MNALAPQVILLTGPSGSGKSSLAAHSGLPVLRLDDFYKEGDDPSLPRLAGSDEVDWDAPGAWGRDAALDAITDLCTAGSTAVPVYDIATSSQVGEDRLDLGGASLFVAEGIFAAELIAGCRERELLADALCLCGRPGTTFRRRLLRDVRESRKSLPILVRRGWRLMRAEGEIVAGHVALGAHACARNEALTRIAALLARRPAPVRSTSDGVPGAR